MYKVLGPSKGKNRVRLQALWGFGTKEETMAVRELEKWTLTKTGDGAEIPVSP